MKRIIDDKLKKEREARKEAKSQKDAFNEVL